MSTVKPAVQVSCKDGTTSQLKLLSVNILEFATNLYYVFNLIGLIK